MHSTDNNKARDALNGFQARVRAWLSKCLGKPRATDQVERTHRALEEAIELAQACGCSEKDALKLVQYVYSRPVGLVHEEVGGVMVTLAALCSAFDVHLGAAAEAELARDWEQIEEIRGKAAARLPGTPLP